MSWQLRLFLIYSCILYIGLWLLTFGCDECAVYLDDEPKLVLPGWGKELHIRIMFSQSYVDSLTPEERAQMERLLEEDDDEQ